MLSYPLHIINRIYIYLFCFYMNTYIIDNSTTIVRFYTILLTPSAVYYCNYGSQEIMFSGSMYRVGCRVKRGCQRD